MVKYVRLYLISGNSSIKENSRRVCENNVLITVGFSNTPIGQQTESPAQCWVLKQTSYFLLFLRCHTTHHKNKGDSQSHKKLFVLIVP